MRKFTLLADKNIQASFKVVLDEELIGQNKEFLFKVHIAASEALQNIVRHIYHFEKNKEVRIWFEKNKNEMTLFIEDDGPPLRDLSFLSLERTPSEKGNMGLNLIKELTKSFNILASQKGNLTILKFEIF
jgi:anti-sigma regulatory factor (Ser/Thr protein kinase)